MVSDNCDYVRLPLTYYVVFILFRDERSSREVANPADSSLFDKRAAVIGNMSVNGRVRSRANMGREIKPNRSSREMQPKLRQ
jgi:hypothetical protein